MYSEKQDIKVSICCITFNQEDYISELINRIEYRTTVLKLKNGGYIIFSF